MSMTITEKILAAHAKKDTAKPGEFLFCELDLVLANDITAPLAIKVLESHGVRTLFDSHKIALVPDHFTPNKDIASAEQCAVVRRFAHQQKIEHYFELGEVGIEHCLLPELGLVLPGDCIVGADSHTCTYGALGAFSTGVGSTDVAAAMWKGKIWFRVPETIKFTYEGTPHPWFSGKDVILYTIGKIGVRGALYKAMEFTGSFIEQLGMDDRLTICNMAVEAGAKNGIIPPDQTTRNYVEGRARRSYTFFQSDSDARFSKVMPIDLDGVEPVVAFPFKPDNVRPVSEAKEVKLDQVVIGSCTNGRLTDLRIAAQFFKGNRVAKGLRCLIFPGTQEIYLQALREGLVETFVTAGCVFSPPTCGPCLGGHMGVLAKGERALSTTNRNFPGRMGHPESEVYLCSPAVAAASALTGHITPPSEIKAKPEKQ